jgi:hypothetical protein
MPLIALCLSGGVWPWPPGALEPFFSQEAVVDRAQRASVKMVGARQELVGIGMRSGAMDEQRVAETDMRAHAVERCTTLSRRL